MAQDSQTVKNHTRLDPPFHFFLGPASIAIFIATVVMLTRDPSWTAAIRVLGGLWVVVATFKLRLYALKVQDRVIRLEERLRLRDTLPSALQPRIGELSEDQLIGLRFASDQELTELVPKILQGNWKRKQIKDAIRVWRPDFWRV